MLSLHTSPLEQPGAGDAGGMNVYIRSLATALADDSIAVDIFTRSTSDTQPAEQPLAPGVVVHNIPGGPPGKLPKEQLPALLPQFVSRIDEVQQASGTHPDVLHSHYWVSGMAGMELAQLWDVPLVHTMHTMAKVKNLHLHSGEAAEPASRVDGERHIVQAACRLVANTLTEAEELQSHYDAAPGRIDVVPPGVDLKTFKPAFRTLSRASTGIAPEEFHVLFVGRIQRLKGPQVLIDAVAELRRQRPDIPLRISIIGARSGSRTLDLAGLVQSHGLSDVVRLHPPVDAEQLAHWYRSADVVAMPSFSESFGLVALEAQACGTPVVATKVGGLVNAISDGRTGLLVKGHRAGAWAAALQALYDDERTRDDMGRAASIYAQSFGWQRTASRTIASYQRAVELYKPSALPT